jgi:hypothetical protein
MSGKLPQEIMMQSFRLMFLLFGVFSLNSGCSSLQSPSKHQPYWELSSEDQSSPRMQAFEDILYWSVYGVGSVFSH